LPISLRDQPFFTSLVKGSGRIAGIATQSKAGFSATVEFEINRSRGRGLRIRANYGLSRDEIVVLRG
jgi:hypothetical protein